MGLVIIICMFKYVDKLPWLNKLPMLTKMIQNLSDYTYIKEMKFIDKTY